ncbi:PRTRC system protein F [Caballeronia sp. LjRoot31]|jgi:PRTRC genetic system protein F|uniref:PRTRC system protein F n=1 Tax=Caballeronia sp. LjRoot31 TaxID=3342324 RepID=UPI003ED138D1
MTFSALSLPSLAGIPGVFTVPTKSSFARPFLLSLIDSGIVTETDVGRRPKSELTIAKTALSRKWNDLTQGMTVFDWRLRIEQQSQSTHFGSLTDMEVLWAVIQTTGGPVSCDELCIAGPMTKLESVREGLGQTVLATLYDAFRMLPNVCTPFWAVGFAEYLYWYGHDNEQDALEEAAEMAGCTSTEEFLKDHEFFTRAQFFTGMPEWAAFPKRVLTRRQVQLSAKRDEYATAVFEAMESLWNIVRFYGPFADVQSADAGADLVDFTLFVRWDHSDAMARVLDDYLQHAGEGEAVVAASVTPINVVGGDLAEWLKRMTSTAMLAKAVERVIGLFKMDEVQPAKTLVEVFAPVEQRARVTV